jgi:hypothetical protein
MSLSKLILQNRTSIFGEILATAGQVGLRVRIRNGPQRLLPSFLSFVLDVQTGHSENFWNEPNLRKQ